MTNRRINPAIAVLLVVPILVVPAGGETVEGFAEPYREIEIAGATEPGVLTQVFVREGDQVRQGDLLAKLESGVLEAALEIARRRATLRGRLDAAQAELHMRSDRYTKLQRLRERGHASPSEIERAQADLSIAEAQLALAQEELELARLECARIEAQLEQRVFRSPIDGVVTHLVRETGEAILLNDPALMTLVQLNPLRVEFPVSVPAAMALREGQELNVEIPDLDTTLPVTVELVAPVLDAKSGTVEVTCVIPNDQGKLRSGMRCLLRTTDDKTQPEAEITNSSPAATWDPVAP